MPRDSDKIDVRNSGFYVGTPTFAMKRGNKVPFLMYQLGGDEKSIEEIRDIFGQYLDDDSLGQGYVYNASGLTYGDMNSLMGDSDNWLDDWDGFYSFYEFNNKLSMISSEIIFNIFDNQGTLYEQTYDNGSWGVRVSPRQRIMGHDQLRPNPRGYGMSVVRDAETKEASVGMIVRDGDPSSPPSDIFMAEDERLVNWHGATVDSLIRDLENMKRAYSGGTPVVLRSGTGWGGVSNGGIEMVEFLTTPEKLMSREEEGHLDREEIQALKNDNPDALVEVIAFAREGYVSEEVSGVTQYGAENFQAEDPTQADASNMGGPTAPGNAGVPADVGGDDLVPYDSPSAPPAGVFMNAEYKTYESRPVRNALFGVAFAVSGLYFWSTAGSVVKNWVVVRVEKYAPKLLEPQFQTMLTLTAFFGIIYFGMKLRGSSKGLTIPSMIDLPLESAVEV